MNAGRVARCAGGLAVALACSSAASAADVPTEVRVLSGPGAASAITIRAEPDARVEDHTPGAQPPGGPRGPASTGQTFAGEIDLFLRGVLTSRAASVEVADPVVSAVRLFPEADGTAVTVFVRQPVTYSVSRPSAIGDVRVEVRGKMRALTVTPRGRGGPPRATRPKATGEHEVSVDAESLSYDQQTNTLTARGGVTLTREDTTLTADEVVYDRTNAVVEAKGHVVLTDPQATVEGEFAHLNLDDETGWFDSATATLQPSNFTLRAARLDKQGGPRYAAANGIFTSCQCGGLEGPSWSLAGARTNVTLQGTGVVRNLTFRVKDVPVLWFPVFLFPAGTERQSGFLIPRFGYSNRRGVQYEQPYYWKIDKSSDATIAVDVETEARVGLIGEYRYDLSRDARGRFSAAYFNEQIRGRARGTTPITGGSADVPEDRFAFTGQHVQPVLDKSKFYLDLFAVSDDQFLREINNFSFTPSQDFALRSLRFTTSRTGVVRTWSQGLVSVENAYYQDLIDPQELALEKLPRIQGEHAVPLLGDRLIGRFDGEAIDYQREEGFSGLRGDLGPQLFLPFHLGSALNGSIAGRLRETAYHLTDTDQVALVIPLPICGGAPGEIIGVTCTQFVATCSDLPKKQRVPGQTCVNEPQHFVVQRHFREASDLPSLDANRSQESAEVSARLGTQLSRVFEFHHLGLEKLRHTIEPEVGYLYVPPVSRPVAQTTLRPCRRILVVGQKPLLARGEIPGENCEAMVFSEGYLFDERDAINQRNFLSFGFTTRLLGRGATPAEAAVHAAESAAEPEEVGPPWPPELPVVAQGVDANAMPAFVGPPAPPAGPTAPAAPAREYARLSILQGYDISRPLVGTSHLSDVDIGIRLNPLDYLALSYNTTVNFEDQSVRGLNATAILREPGWTPSSQARYQSPTTLSLSYRFIEENVNRLNPQAPEAALLASPGVNEVDGALYLRLGDYLGFTFLSRYNLNDSVVQNSAGQFVTVGPQFFERDYLVRIMSRCNCWVIDAGLSDKVNPDERLYRVQLTLVGLGSFGQNPFSRTYVGVSPLSSLGLGRAGISTATGGL